MFEGEIPHLDMVFISHTMALVYENLDDWLIFMVMYVGKYRIHGCYGYIINMTLDHVTNVAVDSYSL